MSNVFIVGVSTSPTILINPIRSKGFDPPELFTAKIEFDLQPTDPAGTEKETCHVLFIVPGAYTHQSVIQFFPELKEALYCWMCGAAAVKTSRLWIRDSTPMTPLHQTIVYADSVSKRFYHKDWPKETVTPKPVGQPFTRNVKPEWPVDLSFTIFGKDHLDRVSFNIVYDVRAVNMSDPPSEGKIEFKGHVKDIPESGLREIVLGLVDLSQAPDYTAKDTFEHLLVVALQVMLPDIERKCSVALGSTFQVAPNYILQINNDVRETLRIPPAILLTDDKAALGQSWIVDPLKLAELTASTEAFGINFSVKEVNNPPAPVRTT